MAVKQKVVKQLSKLYLTRDATTTPGSTTLNSAAAKGATALTVAAITNFANGDLIRVGQGEEMEIAVINGAPSGNNIPLAYGLTYAHVSGDVVVEQIAYDLGDVSDGGVSMEWAGQVQDISVSTRRLAFTTLNGFVDASMSASLPSFSLYSLAHATGMLLSRVTGTGVTATPRQIVTDGSDFAGEINMGLIAVGTLMDNTACTIELWGVDMDYTGVEFQLTRGVQAAVALKGVGAGGVISTAVPTFAATTTLRPAKGDTWDAMTEVGYFADTGTNNTINGTPAADATSIVLTSAAGFVAGDWIKVGTGDTVEYHWIDSIATNTLTLRTRLLRAQANGTAVRKVTQTAFAGCTPDGVRIRTGGSVSTIRSATKRLSLGVRPGAATVTFGVQLLEISLPMFAYALGIPQADISGGRLPVGDRVATATIEGLYVKGLKQNGLTAQVAVWGCTLDTSGVQAILNNQGDTPFIPLLAKPASGVQFIEYV